MKISLLEQLPCSSRLQMSYSRLMGRCGSTGVYERAKPTDDDRALNSGFSAETLIIHEPFTDYQNPIC